MGRVKPKLAKRITKKLYSLHTGQFKEDFSANKELVAKFADIPSKKLQNVIAGYLTRTVKKAKQED